MQNDPASSSRPFDLKGMCFCLAIKVGGGELCHVDFPDHQGTYGVGIPLGDFVGADVAFPQLKARFPVSPGQIILFNARLTAHFMTAVVKGQRAVITGFTCRQIGTFVCNWLSQGGYQCRSLNYM